MTTSSEHDIRSRRKAVSRKEARMRLSGNFKLLVLLMGVCLLVTLLVWHQLLQNQHQNASVIHSEKHHHIPAHETPVVLWWTPILKKYHRERQCGFHKCVFSVRRDLLHDAKAVLFYGSDMSKTDLPLPRLPHHLWALLHEESPKNIQFIPHEIVLRHFNFTSTFSRHSDCPLTTQYLKDLADLTSPRYLVPVGEKTRLRRAENLAPIAFVQSICDTMSGRDEYVKELMQHIEVDSYGTCLHNKDMPRNLTEDYLNNLDSPDFYRFLARYKFILSYENGVCNDYISEKFWRPLVIGSVPIYFGSPTIKDWQPNNKSVIHIPDFPHPKALADFIRQLDANDREYNSYLDHKYSQLHPITNERLQHTLLERADHQANHIFDRFECFVCQQIHEMPPAQTRQAKRSHYDCPQPLVFPPMEEEARRRLREIDWNSIAAVGKCEARILDHLLRRNTNFTAQEFDDLLNQDIRTNKCAFD